MTSRTYIITSAMVILVLIPVLFRVIRIRRKNLNIRFFAGFLCVSLLYTLFDGVWGFSVYAINNMLYDAKRTVFYASLCFGILVEFMWYEYASAHLFMIMQNRDRKLYIVDGVPALIGYQVIAINISTSYFFEFNPDGSVKYNLYTIGLVLVYVFYYIFVILNTINHYRKETKAFEKMRSLVVIASTVLLLLGAVIQFVLPMLPFYAVAIMICGVAVVIYNISIETENEVYLEHQRENEARIMVINALSDEYDIIFWVNMENNTYKSFSNTKFYEMMQLKTEGDDFFADCGEMIKKAIYGDDVSYMEENLTRENVVRELEENGKFTIVYRIVLGGAILYYETKFVKSQKDLNQSTVMVGVKNVDASERQELKRKRDIRNLERKELEYRKALQEALENQNEIYAEMLHMQSGGVIVTDMDNRIIICNEAASDIFDMPLNIMMNDIFPDVVADVLKDSAKIIREKIRKLKEEGDEISYEYPVYHIGGRSTYIKADSKLTILSNRNSVIITSLADITSNKEMEQKLVILSETDSLTGLLNRDSGQKRIEQFIKKNVDGMFCIIDINDFKHINDNYGHPIGDKVLIGIAGCLKKAFRRKDILARIGGDEFAVFGADISDMKVGIKCLERLFEFINDISIDGIDDLKVSVSVGAILCDSEEARNYEEIYRLADTAMYTCKGSGTNKYSFYETEQ